MLMFSSDLFISMLTLPHSGGRAFSPKLVIPGNVLVDCPEECPLADSRSHEVDNNSTHESAWEITKRVVKVDVEVGPKELG